MREIHPLTPGEDRTYSTERVLPKKLLLNERWLERDGKQYLKQKTECVFFPPLNTTAIDYRKENTAGNSGVFSKQQYP